MQCPRDKIALQTSLYEANIEVDICPACRGVWLDKGELEAIQHTKERNYAARLQKTRLPEKVDATYSKTSLKNFKAINCPKCGSIMQNRDYGYGSQVRVDVCVEGCGVWLDEGELQSLEVFVEKVRQEVGEEEHQGLWGNLWGSFFKSNS